MVGLFIIAWLIYAVAVGGVGALIFGALLLFALFGLSWIGRGKR